VAISPVGGAVGSVVPPGVRPNAAEILKLCAQLDLVYAQLMSSVRPTPQRMAELLNTYLDTVRRLRGNVAPVNMKIVHKGSDKSSGAPVDVCITPAPPAPPVPIPYPIAPAASATKTPATKQAQRSKLDATHLQIKSGGDVPAAQMGGIVSNLVKGVCEYVLYSPEVKYEGKSAARLADPLFHNRHNR
jgi:hypothetical protein